MRYPSGFLKQLREDGHVPSQVMGLVGRGFGFLISTSLFLAVSGVFKLYFAFLLYGIPPKWNLLVATFFVIFSVYGTNKLTDLKEDEINNPERVRYIRRLARTIRYGSILSFAAALILGILSGPEAVLVLVFPVITGFVYSVRILPGRRRLKDVTVVKNLIIAGTWAGGTALLPLAAGSVESLKVLLVYYFFFIKSLINTVLFDVRDVEGDRLSGVETIPVRFGLAKSRTLLLVLNSTLIPWLLMAAQLGYFREYLSVLLFSILNGYAYILYFTRRIRSGKALDLWVDGEWIYTVALALLS